MHGPIKAKFISLNGMMAEAEWVRPEAAPPELFLRRHFRLHVGRNAVVDELFQHLQRLLRAAAIGRDALRYIRRGDNVSPALIDPVKKQVPIRQQDALKMIRCCDVLADKPINKVGLRRNTTPVILEHGTI